MHTINKNASWIEKFQSVYIRGKIKYVINIIIEIKAGSKAKNASITFNILRVFSPTFLRIQYIVMLNIINIRTIPKINKPIKVRWLVN